MGGLAEADAGEYLSGLLIGAEIAEARRLFPGEAAHVAGAEGLVARYRAAFAALGEEAARRRIGRRRADFSSSPVKPDSYHARSRSDAPDRHSPRRKAR